MQFSICNYAVWYQLVSEFKFVYNYNELFRVSLDRKGAAMQMCHAMHFPNSDDIVCARILFHSN